MIKAKMIVDKDFQIAETSKTLYSSFTEHIGRVIYSGLYDPGNPLSDEYGFRKDVIEATKELNFSLMRYPGGNFVSGYHWEDGVGPKEKRPRTAELAWFVTETNQFGTNEFIDWAKKANVEPMMSVNLGTRGMEDAKNLIEYCNIAGGTYWSDLRRSHGYEAPHKIKYWCLGNEMDGPWQIGMKTADEYGRLACETAKLMKWVDPSIELVACGSSNRSMPTYPQYSATVLEHCYEHVDYLALHQYYGNATENDAANFLAKPLSLDAYIKSSIALCDFVQEKKRSKKKMNICFDEYNVCNFDCPPLQYERWTDQPLKIGEDIENIYNIEDALMVADILMTFLKHADRVKISCLAQLVNATGAFITSKDGIYKQTIFYPIQHLSHYGQGKVLLTPIDSPKYDSKEYTDVPFLDSVSVWNEEKEELTIFAINKNLEDDMSLEVSVRGFDGYKIKEHIVYEHNQDRRQKNTFENHSIVPYSVNDSTIDQGILSSVLPPFSWNVIRLMKA